MPCDIDIFDAVPVTPSDPDDTDVVIFLLADKTVVGRTWGNIKTALVPDDWNWEVTDGAHVDGELHTGEGTVVRPEFIGFRTRVIRNGVSQIPFAPAGASGQSYVLINEITGQYDLNPVVAKDEIIQIQGY